MKCVHRGPWGYEKTVNVSYRIFFLCFDVEYLRDNDILRSLGKQKISFVKFSSNCGE